MIADNEINATLFGIGYLFDCLDATVEHDNEFNTCFCCKVYTLTTYSVTLAFAIGNVIVDVGIELLQKLVDQCYRRTPVHVVVAIYHDALFAPHRIVQAIYGYVHVIHQEGVNQLV